MIELDKSAKDTQKHWSGFSLFGEKVSLNFASDKEPTTFAWSDLKQGHTVAILYAQKNRDSKVIQDCLNKCFVFKSALVGLLDEAKNLLNDSDLQAKTEKSACFGCFNVCEKISRCSSCKLAKYCSVECQQKCWKQGHKKLCQQAETLLRLAALPRQSVDKENECISFATKQSDSLLPYVFKPEFVFKNISTA